MEETKKTLPPRKRTKIPPALARVATAFDELRDAVLEALAHPLIEYRVMPSRTVDEEEVYAAGRIGHVVRPSAPHVEIVVPPRKSKPVQPREGMSKCEANLLAALALRHPRRSSIEQVLALADYRPSGTVTASVASLRAAGYIDGSGDALTITDDGMRVVPDFDTVPEQLGDRIAFWKGRLDKCGQKLLAVYAGRYPSAVPVESALEETGYRPSGTVTAAMARLRLLELVEGPRGGMRASDYLMKGT